MLEQTQLGRIFSGRIRLLCLVASIGVGLAGLAAGEDWARFRGAGAAGKAQASGLPATWDSKENIVWKSALPGLGSSSPVVLGKRIYLTSYTGYAESVDAPGDQKNLMRHLVCLDRASGKLLWKKDFKAKMPESEYEGRNNVKHGYAASTLATDGKGIFAFFGISGVYGFDLEGNKLWNTEVGSGTHGWGSGTSPVLYKNLVIVNASVESKALIALNKKTGKEVWRAEGIEKCWTSPILVDVGGKQELVLSVPNTLTGFDPATGEKIWHCDGITESYLVPTPIAEDGVIYVIGARKNQAIAVRAGGRGDVTKSHVLWRTARGSNVSSPVYLDGFLYWIHESRGTAFCLNAKTGEIVYEQKLDPNPDLLYASVTAADGKLYAPSRENGTYVLAAKPEFELIAVNQFQDDSSRTNASIVVTDNQILLRSDKALYCIGK